MPANQPPGISTGTTLFWLVTAKSTPIQTNKAKVIEGINPREERIRSVDGASHACRRDSISAEWFHRREPFGPWWTRMPAVPLPTPDLEESRAPVPHGAEMIPARPDQWARHASAISHEKTRQIGAGNHGSASSPASSGSHLLVVAFADSQGLPIRHDGPRDVTMARNHQKPAITAYNVRSRIPGLAMPAALLPRHGPASRRSRREERSPFAPAFASGRAASTISQWGVTAPTIPISGPATLRAT